VIPRKPPKRAFGTGGIETSHLHACFPQPSPETPGRLENPSHPVVKKPDPHALMRLRHQDFSKLKTCLVFMDDVHFKMDGPCRRLKTIDPGRVVFSGIDQKADAVSGD
jgi:hypothetical protein